MSGVQPIPSTAKEVRKLQLEKLKSLQEELNSLTILENPLEIENICKSIIELKSILEKTKFS